MNKKKQNLALRSAANNMEIAICTVKLHVGAVCSDSVEERRFLDDDFDILLACTEPNLNLKDGRRGTRIFECKVAIMFA